MPLGSSASAAVVWAGKRTIWIRRSSCGEILARKELPNWREDGREGKSGDWVVPETQRLPCESTAKPVAVSAIEPLRNVEARMAEAVGFNLARATFDPSYGFGGLVCSAPGVVVKLIPKPMLVPTASRKLPEESRAMA